MAVWIAKGFEMEFDDFSHWVKRGTEYHEVDFAPSEATPPGAIRLEGADGTWFEDTPEELSNLFRKAE